MRRTVLASAGVICLLIPALVAFVRGRTSQTAPPAATWTTGFWFWNGSSVSMGAGLGPVDAIYCQAGSMSRREAALPRESWTAWAQWPNQAPEAREYWIVLRSDSPGVPPPEVAPAVAQSLTEVLAERRRRGAHIAGVQFDIDSPTRALREYAAFLKAVRSNLPTGVQISITALLDWFRSGTAIGEVLSRVDEFVPQFYDVGDGRDSQVIAARIEASRWGPVFNRYKRRFRIGVSIFGRTSLSSPGRPWDTRAEGISPFDVAVDGSFTLTKSATDAGETVLKYMATRTVRIGYETFSRGDTIVFTVPTQSGIESAVRQAKLMGGYCAGVVFFRWPEFNESVTALPEDALAAAGIDVRPAGPAIRAVDGGCAAVYCADLYLLNARPLSPAPAHYRIRSSTEVEYVLPRERMPLRMSGPADIEVTLPPYSGRSRIYLGRAVTQRKTEFRLITE